LRLAQLAGSLSSKNAGNFHLTFDVGFHDEETYTRVRDSGALTAEVIARSFGISAEEVLGIIPFDPGRAIKINVRRRQASGDPGESDVYGAQQYAPLLDIEIP
jgi:hypothetical protein